MITALEVSMHGSPSSCSCSHRFPPLAEHIVNEFGHGLGAAGSAPALFGFSAQAGVAHQLCKHERNLLVALSRGELVELAVPISRQPLTLLLAHLTHVAQVLFIAHQEHH